MSKSIALDDENVEEKPFEGQKELDDLLKHVTGGTKFDSGKPRMELLSTIALVEIAKVLTFGADVKKYGAHNWRKGLEWSRVLGAAMRHLTAFTSGEDKDPESGLSHLAHAACCLMFLLEYEKHHKALDDRFKYDTVNDKEIK